MRLTKGQRENIQFVNTYYTFMVQIPYKYMPVDFCDDQISTGGGWRCGVWEVSLFFSGGGREGHL